MKESKSSLEVGGEKSHLRALRPLKPDILATAGDSEHWSHPLPRFLPRVACIQPQDVDDPETCNIGRLHPIIDQRDS